MAAAWTVTFLGSKLIDAEEGVIREFIPNWMEQIYDGQPLPRGVGEVVHHLGTAGATHRLGVTFIVLKAGWAGMFSRVSALYLPVIGSLVVPDFGTWASCLMLRPQVVGLRPCKIPGSTEGYEMDVDFEFRQVFPT